MHILFETPLKARLGQRGVATPKGSVVSAVAEGISLASGLGYPVIVKAVVAQGDRGGTGLVATAGSEPELVAVIERLLLAAGRDGDEHGTVRIEQLVPAGDDHYLACTFDFVAGVPVMLWGPGGSGVEHWLEPERIELDLDSAGAPDVAALPVALRAVASSLFDVFVELQARLVELNPVRVVGEEALVLDAKAVLDPFGPPPPGDATEVMRPSSDAGDALVATVAEIGSTASVRYEDLGGDVGVIVWGGGASMIVLDAMLRRGLAPANYSDMSAGSSTDAVIGALARTVLGRRPSGAVIGSTVSSALSAREVAYVIARELEASVAARGPIPVAVRLAGQDEAPATARLHSVPRVRHFGRDGTLEHAVGWLADQLEVS